MAFLEDPRLRQRWNQITHDAEAATENAAAGIWTFQHNYINPCLGGLADSFGQCATVCFGDPEERVRRKRERERAHAEYSFDFYDDWYEEEGDEGSGSGLLGGWGNEDWDRLLAGTGSSRRHGGGGGGGETTEQPKRKRGMSYGTRSGRRKASSAEQDPTIIPSTQPIGFLSKLPWKMGGTLRYKPSAADLQDHPRNRDKGEAQPLLGSDDESDFGELIVQRKRSGTTGSGDTSDSYRSRGDLFPSDGEGEEDAVALDDEVTYDMIRKDDRSSGKTRSRSSKGKRPAGFFSRTVSRTTLGSTASGESVGMEVRSSSASNTPVKEHTPILRDSDIEEQVLKEEDEVEEEGIEVKMGEASNVARQKAFNLQLPPIKREKPHVTEDEGFSLPPLSSEEEGTELQISSRASLRSNQGGSNEQSSEDAAKKTAFVPARLPFF